MAPTCAFMYLDQANRSQRSLDEVLPSIEYYLWLRIPDTDFDGNAHIPNRTDHNNSWRYLGPVSNILIGPILGRPLARFLRVPHIELVVIGENVKAATMAWIFHDGEHL
jgi:hypothetical protein